MLILKTFLVCFLLVGGRAASINSENGELKEMISSLQESVQKLESQHTQDQHPQTSEVLNTLKNNIQLLEGDALLGKVHHEMESLRHKVDQLINEMKENRAKEAKEGHFDKSLRAEISNMNSILIEISKKLSTKDHNSNIVSNFAKDVSRKLDNIKKSINEVTETNLAKKMSENDVENFGLSTNLEYLIRDLSSKIDLMQENRKDQFQQTELTNDGLHPHTGHACRRLLVPQKKLLVTAEYLKNVVQELVGEEPVTNEKSLGLRKRRRLIDLKEIKDTLEDVEESITKLGRQQDRNVNENEKILRRLERKIDAVVKDDENDDDLIVNRLKRLEYFIRKVFSKLDDDDDDSDEKKSRRHKKEENDTDEDDDDDDDDSDNDDSNEKRKNRNDSDDSDDDDDNDKRKKGKGRKKHNDDDDSDDDDDDNDDNSKENDDDDDDDNNSDRKSRKSKAKRRDNDTNEDDTDEDDTDEDDDHDNDSKDKRDDSDDDDDDEKESNGRRSRLQRRMEKRQIEGPTNAHVV